MSTNKGSWHQEEKTDNIKCEAVSKTFLSEKGSCKRACLLVHRAEVWKQNTVELVETNNGVPYWQGKSKQENLEDKTKQ